MKTIDKSVIVSIDPGKKGGICFYDVKRNLPVEVVSMPKTPLDFVNLMKKNRKHVKLVVLEKQWAFKEQGHVSAFTLGTHYGFIKGVLQAMKIPFVEVAPQSWIRYFFNKNGIKGRKNVKKLSLITAREMFPEVEIKHDGQSDAVLIARYYVETMNEKSEKKAKTKKRKKTTKKQR
jgi:hypothetical protein